MTDATLRTGTPAGDAPGSSPLLRAQTDQLRLFLAHWRGSLVAISAGTLAIAFAWDKLMGLPLHTAWCLLAGANYLAQAVVCRRLERAPALARALPQHLPWLQATVVGSGVVWGLLPWLVWAAPGTSTDLRLFATLFNLLLIFAVVNAPSSRVMVFAAVLPVASLTTAALLNAPALVHAAIGCAALCGLVLLYGLRVQAAVQATMVERHNARDLAEALARQQQRMLEIEGERTLLLERQRLMRDLHDGLGGTLTSTLIAIEQGRVRPDELADLLRGCVDDLRAVIDSLEPVDHDVVALLATLRFRLGPRLQRQGVQLLWDVHDTPALPWLGPSEALQVLRIVQEMLNNCARHAQAREVRLFTRTLPDAVVVGVVDNGRGFDTQAPRHGLGLRFLVQRAAQLGATLRLQSTPGQGTRMQLRLPLQQPPAVAGHAITGKLTPCPQQHPPP